MENCEMIFEHTSREKDMWRGWLKNGQSVELTRKRYGWDFGGGVHVHSDDNDQGSRMLFLKFWRFTAIIPLGIIRRTISIDDEPQWSVYASGEFGLTLHWGHRRWSTDWPWDWHTLAYEHQLADGSWVEVLTRLGFDGVKTEPYTEVYSYEYHLKRGEVQKRAATVSKRRHVICYRAFKRLGWPRWIKESIEVQFDDEVGERSGSWKGGTIGCGYDLRKGETMLAALRRMERERKF
jgi:hypothetical protein